MVSEKMEKKWEIEKARKEEKKKQVIDFIQLMMEEYNIYTTDLDD